MLWLITSIFVDRFIQIYKYEKFLFSRSEPEEEEKEEKVVSNKDYTYNDRQISYHFKRKDGKSKAPNPAKPDVPKDKSSGKGTF